METLNIIDILKNNKSVNGISLFEHLCVLLNKLVNEKGEMKSYENFELLSNLVKKNHFLYKNPLPDIEVNNIKPQTGEFHQWILKCLDLFKIQNLIEDSKSLELAGIYFGEEETYRIQKSITRLAERVKASQLRFWGKILASKQDYYVAEGIIDYSNADIVEETIEGKGIGVNKLTFWVTDNILNDWIELPIVTSNQINTARQIKYNFTGDLNAEINSYPFFEGKEKHLLKAQIVRITYSTNIAPKELYQPKEDEIYKLKEKEIEFKEEFKFPEYADLNNLDNWVHYHPNILKAGRISHYVDNSLSEEARNAALDELNQNDEVLPRLKPISEDKPFEKFESNWLKRDYGETQQFTQVDREQGNNTWYGAILIKNLSWSGANCVITNSKFINIYIGYGQKNGQPFFLPNQPNDIQNDPEDIDEQAEPNPKEPVYEVEKDSDEEDNKKEDE